uniref:Uncharacterized protein n=1 Tax=Trichobilharzia regenti TaxID=157069 RepID=A0AA85KH83_TRIRE|nr:unnamed protein product [Trichobilharzia regenti]
MCYVCLLPRRAMLADIGSGWKRASGGQTKTWLHQSMKCTTVSLSHVGRYRLLGWGPRDGKHQCRLETIDDIAQNLSSQWVVQMHSHSLSPIISNKTIWFFHITILFASYLCLLSLLCISFCFLLLLFVLSVV